MVLCVVPLFLIILLYPPRAFISSIRCLSLHKLLNALYIFLMFNIYYVLYTILNTHESAIGTHVSPTSWIPLPSPSPHHPSRLLQSTGFGYSASYIKLLIYLNCLSILCMVMYMFQCYFLKPSHPLLPPLHPKSVLYVCVSFGALHVGSLALFLDSIHMR